MRGAADRPPRIAVFFVGEVADLGFNASALVGAEAAATDGLAEIDLITGVSYDQAAIRARMTEIMPDVDGLVFIGGQGNVVTPEIAAAWPDRSFAVVQGKVTGPNLASYDVRQEESAFLAGWLAARLTRTGVVGHLSGHRVPPGLKGRAAFAAGVGQADPSIRLVTGFCGTQDDSAVSHRWAAAEIAAGADILFSMLNGARAGAIRACREGGARQIGNALDWVGIDPGVFVASAVARIDVGVRRAIGDMVEGKRPGQIVEFGLAEGDFVGLSLGDGVPEAVAAEVDEVTDRIRARVLTVPITYAGPEFDPGELACDAGR